MKKDASFAICTIVALLDPFSHSDHSTDISTRHKVHHNATVGGRNGFGIPLIESHPCLLILDRSLFVHREVDPWMLRWIRDLSPPLVLSLPLTTKGVGPPR